MGWNWMGTWDIDGCGFGDRDLEAAWVWFAGEVVCLYCDLAITWEINMQCN